MCTRNTRNCFFAVQLDGRPRQRLRSRYVSLNRKQLHFNFNFISAIIFYFMFISCSVGGHSDQSLSRRPTNGVYDRHALLDGGRGAAAATGLHSGLRRAARARRRARLATAHPPGPRERRPSRRSRCSGPCLRGMWENSSSTFTN